MMVEVLPVPRTEVSRNLLSALATRPETLADALHDLRCTHRFQRLTVGRFFWEIDRLIDAGYLRSAFAPVPLAVSAPVEVRSPGRARVRSGRVNVSVHTRAFDLHVDLSVSESDSVIGGDES